MKVSIVGAAEVAARAVSQLGLPPQGDGLSSDESLCALLRRGASFLCPASPRQIVDAVLDVVDGLDAGEPVSRERLNELIDSLVAAGDLLELRDSSERQRRQLFLAPPSFVVKSPGRYLLLGVRPFAAPLVDGVLAEAIVYDGTSRTISLDPASGPSSLADAGLSAMRSEDWVRTPRRASPSEFLAVYRNLLDNAGPAGHIEGLTLFDPAAPVRFYQGRRRPPRVTDMGDYVCRRPQAYGSELWCVVRLRDGQPVTMIDLPYADPMSPGRYEAWRILAALDAERGAPQIVRVRSHPDHPDERFVDVFGPVPGWAERSFELAGAPGARSSGALLSYCMPSDAVDTVTTLLADLLWMDVEVNGGSQ